MGTRTTKKRRLAAMSGSACLAFILAGWVPAAAQQGGSEEGSMSTVDVGPEVQVVPLGEAVLSVDGRVYRGRFEVTRSQDSRSVRVTNVVPIEDYVKGVREMDPSWSRAALEAQAIAARSLVSAAAAAADAGRVADEGAGVPTYRGVAAEAPEWTDAVGATQGRVLESAGQVAGASYTASAGGMTVAGRPDQPYLRPTDMAAAESAYPLYRWTTRIGMAALHDILTRAGRQLGGAITGIAVDRPATVAAQVVVSTATGSELRIPLDEFVSDVNRRAPDLFPDTFPPPLEAAAETFDLALVGPGDADLPRDVKAGSMPATLPSQEFTVRNAGAELVFEGRGWGNRLGMSKLAAKDFAEAGGSTEDILGRFYPGTTIVTRDEGADVRVLVAEGPEVSLAAEDGFMRIEEGSDPVVRAAHDPWVVRPGPDGGLELLGPPGFDAPLEFADFSVPLRVVENRRLPVEFRLSRPADVSVHIDGPAEGGQYRNRVHELGILPAGELQSVALDGVAPGTYRVTIEAHDGEDTVSAGPLTVDVAAARRGPTLPGAVGLVAFCSVLAVLAVRSRGRRRRRTAPARAAAP